jgi:hypothetical protein
VIHFSLAKSATYPKLHLHALEEISKVLLIVQLHCQFLEFITESCLHAWQMLNFSVHESQSLSVQTLLIELGQVPGMAHPPEQPVLQFSHDKSKGEEVLYTGVVEKAHAGKLVGTYFSDTKVSVFPVMKYAINPAKKLVSVAEVEPNVRVELRS